MEDPRTDQQNDPQKNGIAGYHEAEVKMSGNAYETLQANNAPVPGPEKHTIQESIDLLHKDGPLQNLRTYQSDVADAVKKKDVSQMKMATGQAILKNRSKSGMKPASRNLLMIAASILLLGGGILIFILFFLKNKPSSATDQVIPASNVIISVDSTKNVNVPAGTNTLNLMLSERPAYDAASEGKFIGLNLMMASTTANGNSKPVPLDVQTFVNGFQSQAPSWFALSLAPNYLTGFYNDGGTWQPFIILKISSYEDAFAGMLKWESTIPSDLSAFFAAGSAPIQSAATSTMTASTTSTGATTTPSSLSPAFQNKDARQLAMPGGTPLLFYSFPDKQTLVITTSQNALQEIFARLVTSQFAQ
jgi:hypothetical protein